MHEFGEAPCRFRINQPTPTGILHFYPIYEVIDVRKRTRRVQAEIKKTGSCFESACQLSGFAI